MKVRPCKLQLYIYIQATKSKMCFTLSMKAYTSQPVVPSCINGKFQATAFVGVDMKRLYHHAMTNRITENKNLLKPNYGRREEWAQEKHVRCNNRMNPNEIVCPL